MKKTIYSYGLSVSVFLRNIDKMNLTSLKKEYINARKRMTNEIGRDSASFKLITPGI